MKNIFPQLLILLKREKRSGISYVLEKNSKNELADNFLITRSDRDDSGVETENKTSNNVVSYHRKACA